MAAYYNENDPFAVAWLRNLIAAGEIAPGDVDDRSICDVQPDDLVGYTQCHFFAGIGLWSYALRLAGWPDGRPVWTGSCPCQPFSGAGKQRGTDDERHLWPEFRRLIAVGAPPVVFGEQVASPLGLDWLHHVRADMEAEGYAFGGADLCAAGVGAPQIRQRLYFTGLGRGWLAGADGGEWRRRPKSSTWDQRDGTNPRWPQSDGGVADGRDVDGLVSPGRAGAPTNGFWADADWLFCRDGVWRPVEPGTFPLADGYPTRVGRLRAYGNAIVPQVAAVFIGAVMDLAP